MNNTLKTIKRYSRSDRKQRNRLPSFILIDYFSYAKRLSVRVRCRSNDNPRRPIIILYNKDNIHEKRTLKFKSKKKTPRLYV